MNWAIKPSSNLSGNVEVPGDKSISHRALMHAAVAHGTSRITNFLHAGVTEAMLRCVRELGVEANVARDGALIVQGGEWQAPSAVLDCGNSGATIRMLMGALAGRRDLMATVDGSAGLQRRPMKRVTEPLRLMGANIVTDTPPIIIHGQALHGIEYTLPVASAQIKAAILLAAIQAEGVTMIHEPGPSRDHSERLLNALGESITWTRTPALACGASVDPDGPGLNSYWTRIEPNRRSLSAFQLTVPGDISSAAFLLAAAALTSNSRITIESVGVNPTRTGILDALTAMGADVRIENQRAAWGEPIADVTVQSNELHGVTISGEWVVRMIDEFPILAVLATQARGETIVRDAQELRVKESDRIGSLASELRKLGAHLEEQADGFVIDGPTRLHGAIVDSHGDHRLAMSLAVAGLIADGETTMANAEAYRESFPNFVELMRSLGASIE